jgi:HAD superfamily hydrolase (TIGR01484 family)
MTREFGTAIVSQKPEPYAVPVPYRLLACDYDGTLATRGMVDAATEQALDRWLAAGRRLVLVTGRQLPDVISIFPRAAIVFEWIVAENGPVLYRPQTGQKQLLAPPPPQAFRQLLEKQGVTPLNVGDVVVASDRKNGATVLAAIQELGLQLEVIFNKESLMVLPNGVSKATGLTAALKAMSVPPAQVAGIGDAENDAALIGICGLGVAVANAVPELKAAADRTTLQEAGAGVAELIDDLLRHDRLPGPAS